MCYSTCYWDPFGPCRQVDHDLSPLQTWQWFKNTVILGVELATSLWACTHCWSNAWTELWQSRIHMLTYITSFHLNRVEGEIIHGNKEMYTQFKDNGSERNCQCECGVLCCQICIQGPFKMFQWPIWRYTVTNYWTAESQCGLIVLMAITCDFADSIVRALISHFGFLFEPIWLETEKAALLIRSGKVFTSHGVRPTERHAFICFPRQLEVELRGS